ncbi:hypothetical protein [Flavobacterium sp. FlaQc-50]|uniref:hypothetical protein n=1 Tax=unclassified Flavobacterium TaxID=196869 RepID=UPI0037565F23
MKRKPVKELLSKDTVDTMKEQNIKVKHAYNGKSRNPKYCKVLHVEFFTGYDLLEILIVARPYIQKRYNIDQGLLELLLYLSPKQFFTQKDYAEMPKQFKYCSIKNLMDTGFIGILQKGENLSKHIYHVNRQGSELVRHFYEILSGEKKIPEDYNNPLARKKTRTPFDKKKMDLIAALNQLPAPEKKKALYR